ncbi:MAG: EAL domain-containing protein [Azoarcus sp.]|nr:EAL domain-containing protein [Azoarcus sp.]
MSLDQSILLQRRIQFLAVTGILVTGLLVAIATAVPIYRHAHELVASSLQASALSQAQSAGQFLSRTSEIALQIASRSGVRDKLEEYNNWQISLPDLVLYSAPRIRDALDQTGNIAGLVRFDRDNYPVLELGLPLPVERLQAPGLASTQPLIAGPVMVGAALRLLVVVPILSRDGQRVGTDLLAFDITPLEQLLSTAAQQDDQTRQLLFNRDGGTLTRIGHSGEPSHVLDMLGSEHDLLMEAAGGAVGMKRLTRDDGRVEVAVFSPMDDLPGWGFALLKPAREFDTPVLTRLISPLLTIIALVLAGAWLTARAIRPMASRVLAQSRQLAELSESMALAASVFEGSPQAVLILDAHHRIVETNHACQTITGFTVDQLRGRTLCDALCVNGGSSELCAQLWDTVGQVGEWQGETRLMRDNGETFPAWHSVNAVRDGSGHVRHHISMFSDIGDKKRAEERIRHLAHHDSLTNLPNRSLLADRLAHALDRARRGDERLALLFIDLDRFKHVNDSLGHPVGDRLLQTVARRLDSVVREQDTLARQGGDEFVVILEEIDDPEDAARVALKLLSALEAPVVLDQHEIFVGASIGISLFPDDGDSSEELLRSADSAMYEAKEAGRSTYRFYTAEQTRISRERFELESGLRRALERDELRLFFQPQADCADGRLIGVEALVRWQHPERGLVPPDRFIPLAEDIGLIGQIGDWVLNTACAQARQWELQGRPLRVAVNLSGQQISHGDLFDTVQSALQRSGLSPHLLELEITEGHILKGVEACILTLRRVKTLGVTMAIDDFGTGYSSLNYLKRLPVDRLKIDRSFVEGIPLDRDDVAIVATILSMARNLGMEIIAEGVETTAQLGHLIEAQCTEYQGYLLGRPVPVDELEGWMAQRVDNTVSN